MDLILAAPAERVWEVIGVGFAGIGDWATVIPSSTALPAGQRLPVAAAVVQAPVAGRVCDTGIRLVPQVTETLVVYDDAHRTLTYEASGLPAFMSLARNTWTVTALDENSCRLSLRARFDTRGLSGWLGRWAILAQTWRYSRRLADDLRHYVETGTPSTRKQAQQRRRAATKPR